MKDKIRKIIEDNCTSPADFARRVNIQPAAVSHLLSGRNNPSFELVQKILQSFPEINSDWFIMDKGPAYRQTYEKNFSCKEEIPVSEPVEEKNEPLEENISQNPEIVSTPVTSDKSIKKIILVYSDGTFESITPSK